MAGNFHWELMDKSEGKPIQDELVFRNTWCHSRERKRDIKNGDYRGRVGDDCVDCARCWCDELQFDEEACTGDDGMEL